MNVTDDEKTPEWVKTGKYQFVVFYFFDGSKNPHIFDVILNCRLLNELGSYEQCRIQRVKHVIQIRKSFET